MPALPFVGKQKSRWGLNPWRGWLFLRLVVSRLTPQWQTEFILFPYNGSRVFHEVPNSSVLLRNVTSPCPSFIVASSHSAYIQFKLNACFPCRPSFIRTSICLSAMFESYNISILFNPSWWRQVNQVGTQSSAIRWPVFLEWYFSGNYTTQAILSFLFHILFLSYSFAQSVKTALPFIGCPGESQNPSSVPLHYEGKRGETYLSLIRFTTSALNILTASSIAWSMFTHFI